ncbi:MAG: sodium:solute symporter family protein [Vampirovibrio sp.]|nr:sodium:solute symporter family protein [Vampirovibrio sp.]
MDSNTISLLFIAGYFGLILLLALVFNRKLVTLPDFFLAGRSLGSLPITFTFVASWFGAASTIGSVGAFHDLGLSGAWKLVIPSFLSCALITFVMARRVRRQNSLSQPEAVEKHYGRLGQFLLSLVILSSVTVFVSSQMVAGGALFHSFLGLDVIQTTLLITGVVVIYSMLGGYFAVVVTDIGQFVMFTLALLTLLGFCLYYAWVTPDFFQHLSTQIPPTFWQPGENLLENLFLTLTFVTAWIIAPEMWQRMSSARNEKQAFQGAERASIVIFGLFTVVAAIGILSAGIVNNGQSALYDLARLLPHPALTGLVLAGVLAAITSTMDSSINVGSLTLTRDLYQGFLRPQATEKELLFVSRMATVLVVIPATLIALRFQSIIQVLWISADIYASTMFFPIMGLLYVKNPGKWSGTLAMIFGTTAVLVSASNQYGWVSSPGSWPWPSWPYSTLVGVMLSGVGFGLGYWISRWNNQSLDGKPVAFSRG